MPSEEATPESDPQELVTTDAKVVYRNRWMTVREDQTLRHDGVAGIYGVAALALLHRHRQLSGRPSPSAAG